MGSVIAADPARLGRGPLTRWLPVLGQGPAEPPAAKPFRVDERTTPARFLLRVILSEWPLVVPAAALGIGWQVGEALVPVVMGVAIDRALATGDAAQLALWLAALAGVFLMLSLSYRFASRLMTLATEFVQHRLRASLSLAALHVDGPGAARPTGGVVSLMTNDVRRTAAVGLAVFPVAEFSGVVFIAVSLLAIHWPLGLAVLVGAPATVWLMGRSSRRLARDSRVYQRLLADTVGRATDLVAGYRVIKGVRAEDEAARRYREASRQTLAGAYRNVGVLGRFLVGSNALSGSFVAAVAALAAWFAVADRLSIGGLIAAVGLAQALLPPMRMLAGNAVPAWAAGIASSGRVLDALRLAPASSRPSGDGPVRDAPGVELSVGQEEPVRIEPGEMVGLVADERTGAAIAGELLQPGGSDRIRVVLDGDREGVRDLPSYRRTVAVAPHHAILFSGSVGDNIAPTAASPRMVDAALAAAACDDFVRSLDAPVGEMGGRLSGGQRQRLALARVLASDTPVLVLHDPTTAVDAVTEQVIAERLPEVRRGRSTLLIASSPALLAACDRVVDLRGGAGAA